MIYFRNKGIHLISLLTCFDGLVLFVKVTGSGKGLKLQESFHSMWRTKKHCLEGLSVHKGMKLCQETVFTYNDSAWNLKKKKHNMYQTAPSSSFYSRLHEIIWTSLMQTILS